MFVLIGIGEALAVPDGDPAAALLLDDGSALLLDADADYLILE